MYAFFRVDVPKDDLTVAIHCQTNSTSVWWVSIWILHCGQCIWCQVLSRKGWEKDIHSLPFPQILNTPPQGPQMNRSNAKLGFTGGYLILGEEFISWLCMPCIQVYGSISHAWICLGLHGYAWNICSSGGDKTWQCTSQCAEGAQAKVTWTWKALPGIDL